MYKKILAVLITGMLVLCGCTKKEEDIAGPDTLEMIKTKGVITVGIKTDEYPFGYIDKNGKNAGFDADLSRLIAKELVGDPNGVKFVGVDTHDRIMKLYNNTVDMVVATMSVTPKRKEIVDFSTSYYTAGQAILIRKGAKIHAIQDLKNKKVIVVFGSTSESSIRSSIPNVEVLGYKNYTEAYQALKSGKADAIIADDTILLGYALKDNTVKLLPKRYSKEPYAIAFRKESNSQSLQHAVNSIIEAQYHNGTLKKLRANYGIK